MDQQIRYCSARDGVRLAYATAGTGSPLVKAANWLSHLEFDWLSPIWGHLFGALAADHQLIRYDERGTGLSDRDIEHMSFEDWSSDLETVVDATGLERFALLGISQGGPVAISYAAQHPERVSQLILYGSFARLPRRSAPEEQALLALMREGWGRQSAVYRQIFTSSFIPDATGEQMRWFNELELRSASPETAVRILTVIRSIDVSEMAARIAVPTLILHCYDDQAVPFSAGRELATLVPGARFVPLEGGNHYFLEEDPAREVFLREVHAFLGDAAREPVPQTHTQSNVGGLRVVLFTDLVGHTEMMQRLGDAKGRAVLREHERITREKLNQHGGAEVKTMGDGFMASFASITSAMNCAIALQQAFAEQIDFSPEPLHVRVGLNAGEPIEESGDLFGSMVIMASRICAQAGPGEILIPEPVRHLLAGKTYVYADRGETLLKGFEDALRLYEVSWRDTGGDLS